jgi:hypothetical protein
VNKTAKKRGPVPEPGRTPPIQVLNIRGTADQRRWVDRMVRRTHINRSTIGKLALACWAEKNQFVPFPMEGDEDEDEEE